MLQLADITYALRLLRKTPRFTALTILVLAGGLAISIYTFSVLITMLYRDLPIPEGASVVRVIGKKDGRNVPMNAFELAELRAQARTLREFGIYSASPSLLTDTESSRSVKSTYAEWNVFQFTRTQPLMGRGFVPDDNIVGAEPVAVIGHALWQSAFAGDPAVVDRVVRINGRPTRIVGVMPPRYAFPISAEMWLPLTTRDISPTGYTQTVFSAYARLAPGATEARADAELQALLQRLQHQQPRPNADKENLDGVFVASFQRAQTGPEGAFVFAVLNVVSLFILLLACVNVGNMLLARTNERIKEIAVRVALGAPRLRLMLQMMLESAIICLVGGALALVLVAWGLRATNTFLNSTFEGELPFWWYWQLDGGTVLATVAFVVVAILLVSVLPTWSATNISSSALLRDGTRGARGRTSGKISRALVTVEIVLISVVMLVGSAMGIIAYRAAHVDFGMDTTNLVTMPVELDLKKYAKPAEQLLFFDRLLSELRRSGDIEAATVLQELGESEFAVDGVEYNTPDDYPRAALLVTSASPAPIATRLIEGRNFDSRDSETGLKTIIVSQSLAQMYWPDSTALGKRVRLMGEGTTPENRVVVGVVSDIRRGDLLTNRKSNFTALYLPLPQFIQPAASVLVKHRGSVGEARNSLYRALANVDAYAIPGRVLSYGAMLEKLTLMATTMTDLFIRCGLFAILLAMTGIYGLTSNAVVQRTHEIGLRRAIGASDGSIIALFLRQGGRQLTVGLLVSGAISVLVLYVVSQFAGVGVIALTFIGLLVAAIVTALVLSAVFISTRRAVLQEPAVALRFD